MIQKSITRFRAWVKRRSEERHIDRLAHGILNPHTRYVYYDEAVMVGMPVLKRAKSFTDDFSDLFVMGADPVMQLILEVDAPPAEIIELLSSPENVFSKAMLLVYRYHQGQSVTLAELFALAVQEINITPPNLFCEPGVVAEVGSSMLHAADLPSVLAAILPEYIGNPVAEAVAKAWRHEFSS